MSNDIIDPTAYKHRTCITRTHRHRYHYVEQVPLRDTTHAPVVLLLHGFPDLWYGWRYQIKALAQHGCRVICPSMIGYHETSKPNDAKYYTLKSACLDLSELLDELDIKSVICIGHDWGGATAWRFGQYYPERTRAVASVCTSYFAPPPARADFIPLEQLTDTLLPNFGYQLWFATDEAAEVLQECLNEFIGAGFSPSLMRTLRKSPHRGTEKAENWTRKGELRSSMLRRLEARRAGNGVQLPANEPERDYYLATFGKNGLAPALSWYKTTRLNFDDERGMPRKYPVGIPALFMPAEYDAALPLWMSQNIQNYFAPGQLEVDLIRGGDHWVLQDEAVRDAVTARMITFVERVLRKENAKL
ncbi:uncharacterized protein L969DRAFT_42317 [Mixia osmundae IAM 14324]|uniref:AB hydrolase-1 domain-containing protein n=1 Tax=Mixia osmundae (strain CBS 9802 / IAM 14324 / JCM 22182 / KY 12970) TaxID=764103 RepID=G7DZD6_MIXOS|nr:uncharacterized protein L969DRAFT_42317 [Mixia osmundae IAM 14324]KEI42589.1 hypothetical protein L969DRAFT_42317 [Mixia osmundae IAM 14324]GAA95946.1 hypothetical protein E5Q_02604 [Mixia osmundae IAM 14324]